MNNVTGKELSQADAIVALCVAMVKVDGKVHEKELSRLRMLTYQSTTLSGIDNVDGYLREIAGVVSDIGIDGVIKTASEVLTPEMRETAYAWAVDAAYADGKTLPDEHILLDRIRESLGLHGELAGKIKVVTAIRNRL